MARCWIHRGSGIWLHFPPGRDLTCGLVMLFWKPGVQSVLYKTKFSSLCKLHFKTLHVSEGGWIWIKPQNSSGNFHEKGNTHLFYLMYFNIILVHSRLVQTDFFGIDFFSLEFVFKYDLTVEWAKKKRRQGVGNGEGYFGFCVSISFQVLVLNFIIWKSLSSKWPTGRAGNY